LFTFDAYHELRKDAIAVDVESLLEPLQFATDVTSDVRRAAETRAASRKRATDEGYTLDESFHRPKELETSKSTKGTVLVAHFELQPHYHYAIETGSIGPAQEALRHSIKTTVVEWYKEWLFEDKYAIASSTKPPAIVQELIRNGTWNGEGVTLDEVLCSYARRHALCAEKQPSEDCKRAALRTFGDMIVTSTRQRIGRAGGILHDVRIFTPLAS